MIDETKLIEYLETLVEFECKKSQESAEIGTFDMATCYGHGEYCYKNAINFAKEQPKIGGWIPCSEGKITAEQKCIADLVNFAMTVSDKLKKKDFSLFSPTSGIGGGMKIGMPPICRMSDELLSLHEEVINEAMRAKKDEQMD